MKMFPSPLTAPEIEMASSDEISTTQNSEAQKSGISPAFSSEKAMQMMQKMGWKSGSGLGKNSQGVAAPIELKSQVGKAGLGSTKSSPQIWTHPEDEISIEEKVIWLESGCKKLPFSHSAMINCIQKSARKYLINDETKFCNKNILEGVLRAKEELFEEFDIKVINEARARANPYELIKSACFMNRAAIKMANIDAATDFTFTNINSDNETSPVYFADICAGPGGFTEYILWRKSWFYKGLGLTLRNENDFKLSNSKCACPSSFHAFYGAKGDGNICDPANIRDFKQKVLYETENGGVHFVSADGGFSVEGNENIQEILSKNIYICQCLVCLEILKIGGHFVMKLFDVFTPFSVGLIYLVFQCFEKITILKPNSSRPANSERYLVCLNLKNADFNEEIRSYLRVLVDTLWDLQNTDEDITEIVPMEVLKGDDKFFEYISNSNNKLAESQRFNLEKVRQFCRNPNLVDNRQENCRKSCLERWKIPENKSKTALPDFDIKNMASFGLEKFELLLVQPREIRNLPNLSATIANLNDWHYCLMQSSDACRKCSFYAATSSSNVYKLNPKGWVKTRNLRLASGTLLYGELVKERSNLDDSQKKYSLHVIDALRLANESLLNLSFQERIKLVGTYCKAMNHEDNPNSIRIRPKIIKQLRMISLETDFTTNCRKEDFISALPNLGYYNTSEFYQVNSVLLLKTNFSSFFYSTYVLRAQIYLNSQNEDDLSIEKFVEFIQNKNS